MRKLFFLLLLAAVTTFTSHALIVTNTAGQLAQAVDEDVDISTLTVAGTMDARDFLFITNELNELTTLDLSQATIVPYNKGKALYGTVTTYAGSEIPRTAFFGKKLVTVKLPANLESIGYAAFAGCYQLTSITLPETLSLIDDYAFSGSALTSIEIPESLMFMGKGVFSRCENLVTAVIKGGEVGDFAFLGDFSLNNVQIGGNVRNIGAGSFNGCTALTTLNIANNCKMSHIGEEAFINSGLENINISSLGLGTIGDWAFAQTNLSSISLTDGMSHLGEGAFAHNHLLTNVVFPKPATGHSSGNGPLGPSRAHIVPQTLERVYDFTFAGDELLNPGRMLPDGVISIGGYAFYNVSNEIDTMCLPQSLVSLGDYAMAGMIGMRTLKTNAVEVPAVGKEVWAGVNQSSVPLITPDATSAQQYMDADQWREFFYEPNDDFLYGDVNGDGVVNIADVTTLIDYLLTGEVEIQPQAADVSHDETISISDVTSLIDYLLTGNASKAMQRIRTLIGEQYATTSDALALQSISMRAGETRTIDVMLNNDEHQYVALQCEVVLPQGLELVDITGIDRGNECSFYSRQHEVEKNIYSIIGLSESMTPFAGNEGNILQLTVTANSDFNGLNHDVIMANVLFVTHEHLPLLATDAIGKVSDKTGVDNITANKQIADVRYINVAGQQSEAPFDGVNIVVTTYTDGTTSTAKIIR